MIWLWVRLRDVPACALGDFYRHARNSWFKLPSPSLLSNSWTCMFRSNVYYSVSCQKIEHNSDTIVLSIGLKTIKGNLRKSWNNLNINHGNPSSPQGTYSSRNSIWVQQNFFHRINYKSKKSKRKFKKFSEKRPKKNKCNFDPHTALPLPPSPTPPLKSQRKQKQK